MSKKKEYVRRGIICLRPKRMEGKTEKYHDSEYHHYVRMTVKSMTERWKAVEQRPPETEGSGPRARIIPSAQLSVSQRNVDCE